jgi:hypothetical protein
MYKYAIITYNFGKNYELLREVEEPDEAVEYICVTDNPELKSNTWKIVLDFENTDFSAWYKVLMVRYNPFKYTKTEIVITIDGSMQIKKSLDKLVEEYDKNRYLLGTIVHPLYKKVNVDVLENLRNGRYKKQHANRTMYYFKTLNYNVNTILGYYMTGLLIRRNNTVTNILNQLVIQNINYISLFSNLGLERIDQYQFTYILNTYFKDFSVMPISYQCICCDYIQQYKHNSSTETITNINYNTNIPEYVYC